MLSFAKVVSGQIGEPVATAASAAAENPVARTASPPRSAALGQKTDHKSEKRHEKGERQDRMEQRNEHDRNFGGNRRRPPKYRDRQEKRGIKPEPVKEEKAAVVEEPPVPQEPVVLEPAPLPAVNAWFRNKGRRQ